MNGKHNILHVFQIVNQVVGTTGAMMLIVPQLVPSIRIRKFIIEAWLKRNMIRQIKRGQMPAI